MDVKVYVFEDIDKNGEYLIGYDRNISGIYITLRNNITNECISAKTTDNGYLFENLENTSFTLYETCANITGIHDESFFDDFTALQPIEGYISTTYRKKRYDFNPNNTPAPAYFGHAKYNKIVDDEDGYVVGGNNQKFLYKFKVASAEYEILAEFNVMNFNALGFNESDSLLYAMRYSTTMQARDNKLYRIFLDDTYNYQISPISKIYDSTTGNEILFSNTGVGCFDNRGYYYAGWDGSNIINRWFGRINLNPVSLNYLQFTKMSMKNFGEPTAAQLTRMNGYNPGTYALGDFEYSRATNRLYTFVNIDKRTNGRIFKVVEFQIDNINNQFIATVFDTDYTAVQDYYNKSSGYMVGTFAYDDGYVYLFFAEGKICRVYMNTSNRKVLEIYSTVTGPGLTNGDSSNVSSKIFGVDFGNAAESEETFNTAKYKSKLITKGPRHVVNKNILLGRIIYQENDAIISEKLHDNDSVSYPLKTMDRSSDKYILPVQCFNNTGTSAKLYAWLDFNTDGIFDKNEAVIYDVPSIGESTVRVEFTRPAGYKSTRERTYIRLRITTENLDATAIRGYLDDPRSISYYSAASDGEVEDYLLDIGDVPNISCNKTVNTQTASSGELVIYTITVENTGSSANNVTVKDDIDETLEFINGYYEFVDGALIHPFTREQITVNGVTLPRINRNERVNFIIVTKVRDLK